MRILGGSSGLRSGRNAAFARRIVRMSEGPIFPIPNEKRSWKIKHAPINKATRSPRTKRHTARRRAHGQYLTPRLTAGPRYYTRRLTARLGIRICIWGPFCAKGRATGGVIRLRADEITHIPNIISYMDLFATHERQSTNIAQLVYFWKSHMF